MDSLPSQTEDIEFCVLITDVALVGIETLKDAAVVHYPALCASPEATLRLLARIVYKPKLLCSFFGCPWHSKEDSSGVIPCLQHWKELHIIFQFDPEDWIQEMLRFSQFFPGQKDVIETMLEEGEARFAELRRQVVEND